mmetsp:Transcript_28053/g.40149  ORF Transcript_28053/g.40149 Transcript_28053/m.40149 type:complete len:250 (-) Transcript_28053:64-813(-)|eukprot:CAMPEP_0172437764 /NCGR_PEP_ID=MMETSP1064-20121228/72435_1 /TAXON_ID=202472 /ORGANISM="Aulacoseira subarctica , Strain CCAP 1002/5" /LENGTH=249 /DNA_ID=CAMNT_0013186265 /DNA_START=9 /DNA_END=758 /DNA_ORIENTATION=+
MTSSTDHHVKCLSSDVFPPNSSKSKRVLFFWATWHEQCKPGGPMDVVFESLAAASSSSNVEFWKVEAEAYPQISVQYNVTFVPTFVLLDEDKSPGAVVDRVEGADPARLTQAVRALLTPPTTTISDDHRRRESNNHPSSSSVSSKNSPTSTTNFETLTRRSPVMLFMKGLPSQPKCGFSRQICALLDKNQIPYDAFDILQDEEVRQGLKLYSDWPTFPQLYVKGEFIGGLDICKELDESGELANILENE